MKNNNTSIVRLFEKYLEGKATPNEVDILLDYFSAEEEGDLLKKLIRERFDQPLPDDLDGRRLEGLIERIDHTVLRHTAPRKERRLWRWLPYAAAVLLSLATGFWFFTNRGQRPAAREQATGDIAPGGNKATLTFADGTTIDLSEGQEGIVIGDNGITYTDGSTHIAALKGRMENISISTPKKGTYQITLPDGSKVWLNAASVLKYPSQFSDEERLVELEGEAFFSINPLSEGKKVPFRVVSDGQTVEVLGTSFNISAYADEASVRTTLVEGQIRVQSDKWDQSQVLSPGHQANLRNDRISVQAVDVAAFTGWKDGMFHFDKTPFEEIMRQITRWYGVEVVYKRRVPEETISGKVKRDVSLLGLLDILKLSGMDVSLQGNTLIVN